MTQGWWELFETLCVQRRLDEKTQSHARALVDAFDTSEIKLAWRAVLLAVTTAEYGAWYQETEQEFHELCCVTSADYKHQDQIQRDKRRSIAISVVAHARRLAYGSGWHRFATSWRAFSTGQGEMVPSFLMQIRWVLGFPLPNKIAKSRSTPTSIPV